MHITLRQLEIFLGVYDQKSLSKAAAKLCVTTSAASQSLKELERILGTELFERNPMACFRQTLPLLSFLWPHWS